jgi:DNA-binding transcriptional ArsR family regulator
MMPVDRVHETLAALADPARRQVIELLRRKPRRAGELAEALDLSAQRMSQHLRVLRHSGLVEDEGFDEDARVSVYRLRPEPFSALRHWLDEVTALWPALLLAAKTGAPRARRRRS